ncbi:MAG: hypothetical protein B7C55_05730 [Actinomycetales bacterium mxb001]|nr:MAG: hypothetical protein B7C55_05730 [Actinomycetales bacterium mxb001]
MADESPLRDQAEAFLADAQARLTAALAAGQSGSAALQRARIGQALLLLGRPGEALPEFDEALRYVDLLRADGEHERLRMLQSVSASLPMPGENLVDLDALEAVSRFGRAQALTQLGQWLAARTAVAEVRPFARGWTNRRLRKALDELDDEIARADGTSREAIGALDRAITDPRLPEGDRRTARYERAVHLAEREQYDEAMRESLLLIRDCDDDPALTARARQVLGAALAGLGRDDDATASLVEAFDGFRAIGDASAVVTAAPGLAWRLSSTGNPARAVTVLESALPSARELGDAAAEADLQAALGTARDEAGDLVGAIAAFDAAVSLAESLSDPIRAADARHGEAIARGRRLDPHDAVEALALLEAARAAYADNTMPERAAECTHEAASLLGRLRSYDAAATRYAAARDEYRAIPEVLRADDPGALADCEYNLAVLTALMQTPESPPPPDAFASGGHGMRHAGTAA